MGKAKHDWDTIRSAYVEGINDPKTGGVRFPTLDEVADMYDVSASTLRKRSSQEEWTTQRNMYHKKLEQKRQDQKVDSIAGEAVEFDSRMLRIARAAVSHLQGHFRAVQDELVESEGKRPMSIRQLEVLSRAAERWQKIGRLAMGDPESITEEHTYHDEQKQIEETVNLLGDTSFIAAIQRAYAEYAEATDTDSIAGRMAERNDWGNLLGEAEGDSESPGSEFEGGGSEL